MIKSLEVVIAITLLFIFIITMMSSVYKSTNKLENVDSKIFNIIKLNASDLDFRELISNKDVTNTYNSLYDYIDISYYIEICDSINANCEKSGDFPTNNMTQKSIDYYFYDLNKTLNVVLWIE